MFCPQTISLNWRRCKDVPQGITLHTQPVGFNGKLYIRCYSPNVETQTVLEYTPGLDQWTELPPPTVYNFTIVTLKGQLLLVGGEDKSTGDKTNTILTLNDHPQQWAQTNYPAMPTKYSDSMVSANQHHLIVVGGYDTEGDIIPDVNILDITSNKWKTAQPLPSTDYYYTVLIEDILYLVDPNCTSSTCAHPHIRSQVWCVGDTSKHSILSLISCHHGQHPLDCGG